jgi:DNA-binding response OmpR family regulator
MTTGQTSPAKTPPAIPAPVVEDDLATIEAVKVLLELYGFAVARARTAMQGVAMLAEEPKAVFLDSILPGETACVCWSTSARSNFPSRWV